MNMDIQCLLYEIRFQFNSNNLQKTRTNFVVIYFGRILTFGLSYICIKLHHFWGRQLPETENMSTIPTCSRHPKTSRKKGLNALRTIQNENDTELFKFHKLLTITTPKMMYLRL